MKLKDDKKITLEIINTFKAFWGKFTNDKQIVLILDFFKDSPSEMVQGAILRHLEDSTRDTSGNTRGKYPPSISDIRAQMKEFSEKESAEKKRQDEAKIFVEESPESQQRAAATMSRSNWRGELAKHQGKRDAIIAHLKRAERLDFTNPTDSEAFRPVQAALYASASELTPAEATEIFRAARLPDAEWTQVEEEQAREFAKRRRERAIHPADAQAMRSYAPHLVKIPLKKGRAA